MSSPTDQTQRTDQAAVVSLVFGGVSLVGLVFPPLLGAGIVAIVLGWTSRRRIARSGHQLKGQELAIVGLGLGVLGSLLSLALPALVAYVYIYAAFHGGYCPNNGC